MAAAKRVRWECPNDLHPGVLGSTRPRANATVRFCLPCSEETGLLVPRVVPSLERKRNEKAAARQSRAEAARAREREAKANRHRVSVIDASGAPVELDVGALLKTAWACPEMRRQQRKAWAPHVYPPPVPDLVVRRGAADAGRPSRREERGGLRPESLPIRARDAMSGHALYSGDRIVLTVRPNCGEEWVRGIVIHEAAHAACPVDTHHGREWKKAYVKAVRQVYPAVVLPHIDVLVSLSAWQLDEHVAQAIYELPPG